MDVVYDQGGLNMVYCSSCGQKNNDNARFCNKCGARLQQVSYTDNRDSGDDFSREAEPVRSAPASAETEGGYGLSFMHILLALFWLVYSSGLLNLLVQSYPINSRTVERAIGQADWISAGIIVGLPLAISMLRPILAIILTPLELVKSLLPGRFVFIVGLLSPFAVSWLLYEVGGYSNYPLIHYSLFFGMLITYAILRVPRSSLS